MKRGHMLFVCIAAIAGLMLLNHVLIPRVVEGHITLYVAAVRFLISVIAVVVSFLAGALLVTGLLGRNLWK